MATPLLRNRSGRSAPRVINVFRRDRRNAGDWWSPPCRYFPFRPLREFELMHPELVPNEDGVCIVGGGGLGNAAFRESLEALSKPDRRYALVAWGVGADTSTDRSGTVAQTGVADGLLSFFDAFDVIGTRVWHSPGALGSRVHWVPCASAMHPLLDEIRSQPPVERLGVYEHLRVPMAPPRFPFLQRKKGDRYPVSRGFPTASNRGWRIEEKLRFLARFEFIVTNSYHGVYWATLLGRRVVCHPFKNGLYSFRHLPSYLGDDGIASAMESARTYPHALEECREANLAFLHHLQGLYGPLDAS